MMGDHGSSCEALRLGICSKSSVGLCMSRGLRGNRVVGRMADREGLREGGREGGRGRESGGNIIALCALCVHFRVSVLGHRVATVSFMLNGVC